MRGRGRKRQTLIWVITLVVVVSMVCSLLATLLPRQRESASQAPIGGAVAGRIVFAAGAGRASADAGAASIARGALVLT